MTIGIVEINHIQITVPRAAEEASMRFYRDVLGLEEIPKPGRSKERGGAWFRQGSVEDAATENQLSRRHICYLVADLSEAARQLVSAGVEVVPDNRPIDGWKRFYIQDPGANRIEVAQRLESE